jgi:hypothetical protein
MGHGIFAALLILGVATYVGSVFLVRSELRTGADGSIEYVCPIEWDGRKYEIRSSYVHLLNDDGTSAVKCSPCGEFASMCQTIYNDDAPFPSLG